MSVCKRFKQACDRFGPGIVMTGEAILREVACASGTRPCDLGGCVGAFPSGRCSGTDPKVKNL